MRTSLLVSLAALLIVACSKKEPSPPAAPPGTVLGADRDGLVVACGDGAVAFAELQLPGRKRMSARALLVGRPIPPGTVLT